MPPTQMAIFAGTRRTRQINKIRMFFYLSDDVRIYLSIFLPVFTVYSHSYQS